MDLLSGTALTGPSFRFRWHVQAGQEIRQAVASVAEIERRFVTRAEHQDGLPGGVGSRGGIPEAGEGWCRRIPFGEDRGSEILLAGKRAWYGVGVGPRACFLRQLAKVASHPIRQWGKLICVIVSENSTPKGGRKSPQVVGFPKASRHLACQFDEVVIRFVAYHGSQFDATEAVLSRSGCCW